MIVYGLMKYIEKIPVRYDRVMNILTLGRHSRARQILLDQISQGMEVLDIGCGTGAFAMEAAGKGARVTCVDSSPEMLRVFKEKLASCPDLSGRLDIRECGCASIDHVLDGRSFDVVTSSLVLGELPDLVRTRTIRSAAILLRKNGVFLVCDEFWPNNLLGSLIYHIMFWAFFIPNFILTRTLIQPVKGFAGDLEKAGLRINRQVDLLLGAMSIVWLVKTNPKEASSERKME